MKNLSQILLFLLVPVWALAQEAETYSFSLQEAEDFAVKNSYQVQDKQFEVQKARQTIRETAAIGYPQISASFGYNWNAQLQEQPVPAAFIPNAPPDVEFITLAFGVEHQNQAGLNVNQLLFDATYFVALRATRVFKETKALEKEDAEITAQKNAAQSYYAVLVAERSRDVAKQNLENARKNFAETRKLYDNGFVEKQDADQLELMVNNLQSSYNNAERQVKLAHYTFKYALGISIEKEVKLTDELEEVIISEDLVQQLSGENFQYQNHITYRSLLSQEKGSRLQLSNERAAYYPKLNGFVNHTQTNFSNQFNDVFNFNTYWIPGTTVGASLSWNLFTGFARDAKVQKAKIDMQRIQMAKESTANQLRQEYQSALSEFNYAFDNYNNQKRNLELSEKIHQQTQRKYREGISTSLELTQAENQLLQSQSAYFNSILQLLNAKEKLENALGK